MSRPTVPFDLPIDRLHVTTWQDPVVDAVGHDLRSAYVERFWLPVLGPSTILLARRIARELEDHPEGFDLHLEDTAAGLGLGNRSGSSGPFVRALARTGQFGLSRATGPASLEVRRRLQTLPNHQLGRLSPALQAEHRSWMTDARTEPDNTSRQQRARRLALSLLELGEPLEAAETQLHRWRIHPAVAHEALRWAAQRRSTDTTVPIASSDDAA